MEQSWILDPKFENYWSNYHKGQLWYLKHQSAHWRAKALAVEYENQNLHWLLENVCKCRAKYELLPQPPTDYGITAVQSEDVIDSENDDENFEMEISDDMLDFFAQSMKHKQQRKVIDDNAEIEYVSEEEVPTEIRPLDVHGGNIPDPKNVTDKFKDYVQLYGTNAPRIQAMETAMQCTFHRMCDRKKPKFWPYMPLKP